MDSYWNKVLSRRISRRRALQATGGATAGAALLAACGGDSDGDGKDVSGLLAKATDETKKVKLGGTLRAQLNLEPSSQDPQIFPHNFNGHITYSPLWRVKEGYLDRAAGEIEGDIVESWEMSPDKLTITAKINSNAHFAPLAPVNGRSVDANDVAFSWQRFLGLPTLTKADYAYNAQLSPGAPILSIDAVDSRTVTIKLNEPTATIFTLFARTSPGSFFIVPKEAADPKVLDLGKQSVGSGPFYLTNHTIGVGSTLKKNPGFKQDKRPDLPYVDQVDQPLLQDPAQILVQFRAGNLFTFTGSVADQLQLKQDLPELQLYKTDFVSHVQRTGFGMAPTSPFRDERLRRAWVMTWNRDEWLDVQHDIKRLETAGVPVASIWESGVEGNMFKGWVLDAKSSEFGENGKYFKHDLAEAKKLVAAAGFPDGLETTLNYPGPSPQNPAVFQVGLEQLIGYSESSGVFKVKRNQIGNFFGEYFPNYHTQVRSQFDGVAIALSLGVAGIDPAGHLFAYYNQRGSLRQGTDQTLSDLTTKAIREFDDKRRMELVHEAQRYEGGMQFFARIGAAEGVSLSWPALRNVNVWQGGTGRAFGTVSSTVFIDPEKAPLKKA